MGAAAVAGVAAAAETRGCRRSGRWCGAGNAVIWGCPYTGRAMESRLAVVLGS